MTWVWTHSQSRNGARLVLLAIADAASDDGTNAWPSVATLQRKANLKSDRSVQSAIKELVALGELKVEWNKGRNGSNRYTVLMPKTPAESAPPQNLPPADFDEDPRKICPQTIHEPSRVFFYEEDSPLPFESGCNGNTGP